MCIFDTTLECSNCGECDLCEYNKNKLCDNCGKCLQLEGFDVKAIKIDEVFEGNKTTDPLNLDLEEFSDFDLECEEEDSDSEEFIKSNFEELIDEEYIDALDDENIEYIEDIQGLEELIEEGINSTGELIEKFPGLYIVNKR